MIDPVILIVFFTAFFIISFSVILRRGDDLCALAYLTLFIYTIFTQIVYVYYPELSQNIGGNNAYFGQRLFYDYWLFMFFSFFVSFLVYLLFTPLSHRKPLYRVKEKKAKAGRRIFYILVIMLIGAMVAMYLIRGDEIRYGGEDNPLINDWFAYGYRILVLVAVVLYARYRTLALSPSDKRVALLLFIISVIIIFQISIKGGVRSTLLYFAIGIGTFELHPFILNVKKNKLKLLLACLFIIPLLYILSTLEYVRSFVPTITFQDFWQILPQPGEVFSRSSDLPFFLLTRDYYIPSHSLFVAMAYDIVDLGEVIRSNVANMFVFLKYPTLGQTIIGSYVDRSGDIGRNIGWSFHFFTEGYVAAGWVGIFYNALVWNIGMYLWKRIASSENEKLNLIINALLAVMIVNAMRSPSYLLVKYIWLFLMPVMGLLFLSNGWYPVFLKRNVKQLSSKSVVLTRDG